jgi:hypothetical protein
MATIPVAIRPESTHPLPLSQLTLRTIQLLHPHLHLSTDSARVFPTQSSPCPSKSRWFERLDSALIDPNSIFILLRLIRLAIGLDWPI